MIFLQIFDVLDMQLGWQINGSLHHHSLNLSCLIFQSSNFACFIFLTYSNLVLFHSTNSCRQKNLIFHFHIKKKSCRRCEVSDS